MSEFFYSGPPSKIEFEGNIYNKKKKKRVDIDRAKLYVNQTYTHALSVFLKDHLEQWAKDSNDFDLNYQWYLGGRYISNYQLRSLSGCSDDGECMDGKIVDKKTHHKMNKFRPKVNKNSIHISSTTPIQIDSVCTMHPFYPNNGGCYRNRKVCPNSCDGPCFYPAVASGPLNERDLQRGINALNKFDIVLLTETMDDEDQSAFLADAVGVPRKQQSLLPSSLRKSNVKTKKTNDREKTHYYRDLISNLTQHRDIIKSLHRENQLEIDLYHHAETLNRGMIEKWKREVGWRDDTGE